MSNLQRLFVAAFVAAAAAVSPFTVDLGMRQRPT